MIVPHVAAMAISPTIGMVVPPITTMAIPLGYGSKSDYHLGKG